MKRSLLLCTVIALVMVVPLLSSAALINGIATNGEGIDVGEYYDNWIKYYIPLKESTSGVYGVSPSINTGQEADSVQAENLGGFLSMYIEFEPIFDNPALTASVDFWFKDLDLTPDNDPWRFTETVQFKVFDEGIGDYTARGSLIEDANMNTASEPFSITGDNDLRKISFNDVTDWLPSSGSFKWLLEFTTAYNTDNICNNPCLTNTREKLSAKLRTSPVPEPATIFLFGTGLIGLAGLGRRKFKK